MKKEDKNIMSASATQGGHKKVYPETESVMSHVFAETTHVVAAPYGFACVVAPMT